MRDESEKQPGLLSVIYLEARVRSGPSAAADQAVGRPGPAGVVGHLQREVEPHGPAGLIGV